MSVHDLDQMRTEWHERAVIVSAKRRGEDPVVAIQRSRFLRKHFRFDMRLAIPEAKAVCEDGDGRRLFDKRGKRLRAPSTKGEPC